MKWPQFTDPQFLDANGVGGLNNAMSAISGAIAGVGSGAWAVPGLLSPEAMTVGFAGMVANVGLPQPWGLVASSGTVVHAHGTQTGTDTTSYSVNFAPLVPSSGSVTAYLAATITLIQQNPFPIPGPTEGNSGFNPNYVPTNGYATNTYSIALAAVTGGIDNVNTFELFRTTVTAGQTVLSAYNTIGQVRAGDRKVWPGLLLASGGILSPWQAQYVIGFAASGLTATLPPVSGCGGLVFDFINNTGGPSTVATTGTDPIAGFGDIGVTSLLLAPNGGAISLWGNAAGGCWNVRATNGPGRIRCDATLILYISTTGSDTLNTGLTAGSPFATFNHAYAVAQSQYDGNGFGLILATIGGTYTQSLNMGAPLVGFSSLEFLGNPGSPGSCNITVTDTNSSCISANISMNILLNGFVLNQFSTGTGACINAEAGTIITFDNIIFGGAANTHLQAATGAQIIAGSNYSIVAEGGASSNSHAHAHSTGSISLSGAGVSLGSGIIFTEGFVTADECGVIEAVGMSFSGSNTTGPTFSVTTNGVIITNTGNPNAYFPGTGDGIQTDGGIIT